MCLVTFASHKSMVSCKLIKCVRSKNALIKLHLVNASSGYYQISDNETGPDGPEGLV